MDLSLPRMDGLEATKQIREIDQMRAVPIVAVTAHQETDFRESAKASGFDAYATKPIDFDWLSELIVGLLG
jgi:CheY-like chemotaxis protein